MDLDPEHPSAPFLVTAIRGGDLAALHRLLGDQPGLAAARLGGSFGGRTPLHIATDWPGYLPQGPAVVRTLLAAGADPNARSRGRTAETPLHWAAGSDDVDVADALIDGGADIEAPDGSIGTPLDNAVGYGCWHVARRLAERGARVDKLWHAAALGLTGHLERLLAAGPPQDAVDEAFWQACHGGQLRAADLLLRHGADIHATPGYAEGSAVDIAAGTDTRRELLVGWLRDHGAAAPAPS